MRHIPPKHLPVTPSSTPDRIPGVEGVEDGQVSAERENLNAFRTVHAKLGTPPPPTVKVLRFLPGPPTRNPLNGAENELQEFKVLRFSSIRET